MRTGDNIPDLGMMELCVIFPRMQAKEFMYRQTHFSSVQKCNHDGYIQAAVSEKDH